MCRKLIIMMTEVPKKWRDIPCSWIRRAQTVKMWNLPNLVCIFSETPIKMLKSCFVNLNKIILKFSGQRCNTGKEQQRTRTTWLQDSMSLVKEQTQRWMGQKSPGTDLPVSLPQRSHGRPADKEMELPGTTGCPPATWVSQKLAPQEGGAGVAHGRRHGAS